MLKGAEEKVKELSVNPSVNVNTNLLSKYGSPVRLQFIFKIIEDLPSEKS